jgi:hypothetical protein
MPVHNIGARTRISILRRTSEADGSAGYGQLNPSAPANRRGEGGDSTRLYRGRFGQKVHSGYGSFSATANGAPRQKEAKRAAPGSPDRGETAAEYCHPAPSMGTAKMG